MKKDIDINMIEVHSDGENPIYIPFIKGELLQCVIIHGKDVNVSFKKVEGFKEIASIKTEQSQESLSLQYASTVCLIIETKDKAKFDIVTINKKA